MIRTETAIKHSPVDLSSLEIWHSRIQFTFFAFFWFNTHVYMYFRKWPIWISISRRKYTWFINFSFSLYSFSLFLSSCRIVRPRFSRITKFNNRNISVQTWSYFPPCFFRSIKKDNIRISPTLLIKILNFEFPLLHPTPILHIIQQSRPLLLIPSFRTHDPLSFVRFVRNRSIRSYRIVYLKRVKIP